MAKAPTLQQRVNAQEKKTVTIRHRVIVNRKAGKHPRKLQKAYHRSKGLLASLREALARSKDPRKRALKYAAKFVGVTERPPGSNGGKYIDGWQKLFGIWRTYWCGAFAGAMLRHVGVKVSSRIVYAPYIQADARNHRNGFRGWTVDPGRARAGDVGTLWNGEHVVLLRGKPNLRTGKVKTFEGNTSFADGSQSNGGCVARKVRNISDFDGFALVDYPNK